MPWDRRRRFRDLLLSLEVWSYQTCPVHVRRYFHSLCPRSQPRRLRAVDGTAAGWAVPASARPVRWAPSARRTCPSEAQLRGLFRLRREHPSAQLPVVPMAGGEDEVLTHVPAAPPTRANLSLLPDLPAWDWGHGAPPGRVKPCGGMEGFSWGQGGPQSPGGCGAGSRLGGEGGGVTAQGHLIRHTGLAGLAGSPVHGPGPVPAEKLV